MKGYYTAKYNGTNLDNFKFIKHSNLSLKRKVEIKRLNKIIKHDNK